MCLMCDIYGATKYSLHWTENNLTQIDWMKFELIRSRNQTSIRPSNFGSWYFRFIHVNCRKLVHYIHSCWRDFIYQTLLLFTMKTHQRPEVIPSLIHLIKSMKMIHKCLISHCFMATIRKNIFRENPLFRRRRKTTNTYFSLFVINPLSVQSKNKSRIPWSIHQRFE